MKTLCRWHAGCQGWRRCPVPVEGKPSPAFTPPWEEKSGVCAAKQLFLLPSAGSPQRIPVQPRTPLPASQGREPWAPPGSGSPQRAPEGQSLVWGEPAHPRHPEHPQWAVAALASGPLIERLRLRGQSPKPAARPPAACLHPAPCTPRPGWPGCSPCCLHPLPAACTPLAARTPRLPGSQHPPAPRRGISGQGGGGGEEGRPRGSPPARRGGPGPRPGGGRRSTWGRAGAG